MRLQRGLQKFDKEPAEKAIRMVYENRTQS